MSARADTRVGSYMRIMKRLSMMTAALGAAVAVLVALTVPAKRIPLTPFDDGTIVGIVHVHTNRSDGLSDSDTIAAAAARAGLKFLVFTDHGDGMRKPDAPQYRSGVLCLDSVEISYDSAIVLIAIDGAAQTNPMSDPDPDQVDSDPWLTVAEIADELRVKQISPYPLAGEPRDVVEDVRRLGGFGIAAHPDSPKLELAWRDWNAPFDGIELLNPDTAWRTWMVQANLTGEQWPARRRLAVALLDYPFRPTEVMASLIQPSRAVEQWATLLRRRRIVAMAGVEGRVSTGSRLLVHGRTVRIHRHLLRERGRGRQADGGDKDGHQ